MKALFKPASGTSTSKNSIGGAAWVPEGTQVPVCRCCGAVLQLFVQFDVQRQFALPFREGSHFVLSLCPKCNEIPMFDTYAGQQLPARYWEKNVGNHHAALYRPTDAWAPAPGVDLLRAFDLVFTEQAPASESFQIGGEPCWVPEAEHFTCSCGAEMRLLLQIPENHPFPKLESAPEQPDSFSSDDYCAFLGNEVYVFACEKQCDERAVWITVQN